MEHVVSSHVILCLWITLSILHPACQEKYSPTAPKFLYNIVIRARIDYSAGSFPKKSPPVGRTWVTRINTGKDLFEFQAGFEDVFPPVEDLLDVHIFAVDQPLEVDQFLGSDHHVG